MEAKLKMQDKCGLLNDRESLIIRLNKVLTTLSPKSLDVISTIQTGAKTVAQIPMKLVDMINPFN